MISLRDTEFSSDDEFTSEDGMMIAFGITAYDNNKEPIEDETYGNLKAYYRTWGLGENIAEVLEEIPTKMCT